MIKRNAPVEFIRILYSWLNDVRCSFDWLSMLSDPFVVHCGIRQAGILSPILFSVYVDDLIGQLRALGYGIYVGSVFCGCILYADEYCYPAAVMVCRKCWMCVITMVHCGIPSLIQVKVMRVHLVVANLAILNVTLADRPVQGSLA